MSTDPTAVTTEAEWLRALGRLTVSRPRTASGSRVAVLAAHPDDECLALGGLLQQLHARPGHLRVVVATDGEAAFGAQNARERARLARTRRHELHAALSANGVGTAPVSWLHLRDGALADEEAELAARLVPLLAPADVVVAPWSQDPHPDHQAAGRAALAAAPSGAQVWSYPIWMWHWMRPHDRSIPWSDAALLPLSPAQRTRKAAALEEFTSQLAPAPGSGTPVLPDAVLTHFRRDVEVLFREAP